MFFIFCFAQPRDILCGAADEVLAALKDDKMKVMCRHKSFGENDWILLPGCVFLLLLFLFKVTWMPLLCCFKFNVCKLFVKGVMCLVFSLLSIMAKLRNLEQQLFWLKKCTNPLSFIKVLRHQPCREFSWSWQDGTNSALTVVFYLFWNQLSPVWLLFWLWL